MQYKITILIFIVTLILLATGCMQIHTHIKLNKDGSARITEKVLFSKTLLDLARKDKDIDLASLLEKQAFLDRMKHMGKGISLKEHSIRKADKGAREAVAVFTIPDFADFRYVSPFILHKNYKQETVIKVEISPVRKASYMGENPGEISIQFIPVTTQQKAAEQTDGKKKPATMTPFEQQIFRQLKPVFRDMLKGMKFKLSFESYTTIRTSFPWRGFAMEGKNKHYDLIDISDEDLDTSGSPFLENEEVMLDLLQWKIDTDTLANSLKGWQYNTTLPILAEQGGAVWFKPSRPLFDKYIKGVKLEIRGKAQTVTFEQVGYKEEGE